MYKINNEEKRIINKTSSNKKNTSKFDDILSIPSNPEDLFTLQYPIGHGSFGLVYKAIHKTTNQEFAIKIIDYSKDNNRNDNNIINYNYSQIQQEASLMRLVNNSNYIVKYYGSYFSRKSNTLWLILEYCSSGSVIDLMLAMDRTFNEIELASILEMILQGLILIHSKNLIHRDVKGANILLSEDGYAKLADFGVGVELIDEKLRQSRKGSPYWMSPQVASSSGYDYKTDIWSLGITCIELLEGAPPLSELQPKSIMEKLSNAPPKVEELIDLQIHSDEFKDFILHCLEVDPKKRYSAQNLLNHNFITKYSQGREYIANLVTQHEIDVMKFRMELEKENQKINKDKSIQNDFLIEEDFYSNNNKNYTSVENNMNYLESLDEKMNKIYNKSKSSKKNYIINIDEINIYSQNMEYMNSIKVESSTKHKTPKSRHFETNIFNDNKKKCEILTTAKTSSNEDNYSFLKKKYYKYMPKDTFDILLDNMSGNEKENISKNEIKEFNYNQNDISIIDNNLNFYKENINDSDDEGQIGKKKSATFFKGVKSYLKFT